MTINNALIAKYPNLTAAQQRQVRDAVFNRINEIELALDSVHARGNNIMTEVAALQSFVTTNSADFTADGTFSDAATARTNILQSIADYANGQSGISGATVA